MRQVFIFWSMFVSVWAENMDYWAKFKWEGGGGGMVNNLLEA